VPSKQQQLAWYNFAVAWAGVQVVVGPTFNQAGLNSELRNKYDEAVGEILKMENLPAYVTQGLFAHTDVEQTKRRRNDPKADALMWNPPRHPWWAPTARAARAARARMTRAGRTTGNGESGAALTLGDDGMGAEARSVEDENAGIREGEGGGGEGTGAKGCLARTPQSRKPAVPAVDKDKGGRGKGPSGGSSGTKKRGADAALMEAARKAKRATAAKLAAHANGAMTPSPSVPEPDDDDDDDDDVDDDGDDDGDGDGDGPSKSATSDMGECIRAQKRARIASYVQICLALAPASYVQELFCPGPRFLCARFVWPWPPHSVNLTWEVQVPVVSFPGGRTKTAASALRQARSA